MAGHLAPEVVFLHRCQGGMGVGAANHPELERVDASALLDAQSGLQCGSNVLETLHPVFLGGTHVDVVLVPGAVIGKFVIRRQQWVCLAIPLHLRDFDQRLPAQPFACIGHTDRFTVGAGVGKHKPAAQVAVVRNRQCLASGVLFVVRQVAPERLRVLTVEGGKRRDLIGACCIIPQHDHTVQVVAIGHGRPFETDQCGKDAGLVGGIRHASIGLPGGRQGRGQRHQWCSRCIGSADIQHHATKADGVPAGKHIAPAAGCVVLHQCGVAGTQRRHDAHVFRVVGDDEEIQGLVHTRAQTGAGRDRVAAGEAIGVGSGEVVYPEQVGIEGGCRVQVCISPVHLLRVVAIRPGRVGLCVALAGNAEQQCAAENGSGERKTCHGDGVPCL